MGSVLSPLFTWRSAIASAQSGLPPTVRHVALTLSLHMSERGDSCFPGMTLQVEETGLGLSTVRSALKQLADAGWLEREISHGRGQSNRYRALIPNTYRQEMAVSETVNRQETELKPPPPGHEDDMRTTKRKEPKGSSSLAIQLVYDHWRAKRGKTRANYATISAARRRKIKARLTEFSEEDLCAAIDAVAADPWPERARNDDITVLFRSRESVERWLDRQPGKGVTGVDLKAYDRYTTV